MTSLIRVVYFAYCIRQINIKKLNAYLGYASRHSRHSRLAVLIDAIGSTFKYNISLLDYFYFRFFELKPCERYQWAGTGYMYEFQLHMNPKKYRNVLINKILFLHHYKNYVKREYASLEDMEKDPRLAEKLLANSSGKLVLKNSCGQIGEEVEIYPCAETTPETMIKTMHAGRYNLAEEFVMQHKDLMALSPSGLNTVRVITQFDQGRVEFLGARLRITVNSAIDNLAAGNIAAPIDMESGMVNGPGVYSDITKNEETRHPLTGRNIFGFCVPFWPDILEMARRAAMHMPENRSVGWDIAVTPSGPELIEGNHNWCKLLWQLPVKKGLKSKLEKYILPQSI